MQFAILFSSSIINTMKMYILISSLQLLDAVLPSHSWGWLFCWMSDRPWFQKKKKESSSWMSPWSSLSKMLKSPFFMNDIGVTQMLRVAWSCVLVYRSSVSEWFGSRQRAASQSRRAEVLSPIDSWNAARRWSICNSGLKAMALVSSSRASASFWSSINTENKRFFMLVKVLISQSVIVSKLREEKWSH